jgi:hypothetical protein
MDRRSILCRAARATYDVLSAVRTPSLPFTLLCIAKRLHIRYKRGTAGRPRAAAVPRPEPLRRCHWRLPWRARVLTSRVPNRDPSTSPCAYYSSPTAPSHRHAIHLTEAVAPAADTGRRRGAPPLSAPLSQLRPKPASGKPRTTFHPFPTLPGELLAGILASRQRPCRGPNCKPPFFPGASVQNFIFNSKAHLLILVKSLKNCKKFWKIANSILLDSW